MGKELVESSKSIHIMTEEGKVSLPVSCDMKALRSNDHCSSMSSQESFLWGNNH